MANGSPKSGFALFRDTTVTTIVVGIVAIGLSLFLSISVRSVGYRVTFLSLAFATCVLIIDLFIIARLATGQIVDRLDAGETRLSDRLDSTDQRLFARLDTSDGLLQMFRSMLNADFIKTQAEVMEYEKTSVMHHVWILSSALDDELKPGISEVIAANLKRGVQYLYIIPNDIVVIERVRQIKHSHGNHSRVKWFHMPTDFFDLVPPHDISIYDPLGKTSDQIVGFMNLPARSAPNNLFVLLNGTYATGIVRRVTPMAKEAGVIT